MAAFLIGFVLSLCGYLFYVIRNKFKKERFRFVFKTKSKIHFTDWMIANEDNLKNIQDILSMLNLGQTNAHLIDCGKQFNIIPIDVLKNSIVEVQFKQSVFS